LRSATSATSQPRHAEPTLLIMGRRNPRLPRRRQSRQQWIAARPARWVSTHAPPA
jgi:hypothetical protein